jgi:hypothetical protein
MYVSHYHIGEVRRHHALCADPTDDTPLIATVSSASCGRRADQAHARERVASLRATYPRAVGAYGTLLDDQPSSLAKRAAERAQA